MDATARLRVSDGLEVNAVVDGYVIYDPARDRIHHLNHTAVLVLELCDGSVAAGELAPLLQSAYGLSAPPVDEVQACVEALIREGLLR